MICSRILDTLEDSYLNIFYHLLLPAAGAVHSIEYACRYIQTHSIRISTNNSSSCRILLNFVCLTKSIIFFPTFAAVAAFFSFLLLKKVCDMNIYHLFPSTSPPSNLLPKHSFIHSCRVHTNIHLL